MALKIVVDWNLSLVNGFNVCIFQPNGSSQQYDCEVVISPEQAQVSLMHSVYCKTRNVCGYYIWRF